MKSGLVLKNVKKIIKDKKMPGDKKVNQISELIYRYNLTRLRQLEEKIYLS